MVKVKRAVRSCSLSTSMKRTMLHAGWLTKSPPERKTQGAWRFFKSQWRRRYFVLSPKKASNTLPGSCPAELEYFETEKMGRFKGRINLDNCEKVVIHMESEYYKHVFVIKTTDRGHNRTYYLAADNEMDMERWVEQLRSVLGLQDEDQVPFAVPTIRPIIPPTNFPQDLMHNPPTTPSVDSIISPLSGVSNLFASPPLHEDYLPIDQCNSGLPALTPRVAPHSVRVVTIRTPAPVSPSSLASSHHSCSSDKYYNLLGNDSLTSDDVYNYPKPYNRDSDVYKVPSLGENFGQPRHSDIYKVPPTRNGSGHNFSYDRSSCEGSRDSNYDYPPPTGTLFDRDSNYDYPPGAVLLQSDKDDDSVRPIWECESRSTMEVAGDTYDIMPPRSNSHQLLNGASFSSPPPRPPATLDDVYDMPGRSASQVAPPKGHKMPPNVHRYINAAPTPVARGQMRSLTRGSADEPLYLPMESGDAAKDVYMPMNQMDKLGNQPNSLPRKNTGTLPPPPAPHAFGFRSGEIAPKAPMTLPRSSERGGEQTNQAIGDQRHLVDSFRGTQRTRSFKRNILAPSNSNNVSLPLKKSGAEDSSSDEDEDEESEASSPVQEYINLQNVGGSDLESPAVSPPSKPAVQYLDLDLEGTPTTAPSSTIPASSTETQNKVEYNEIDMEKTKALFDAKLMLEKERKGSEKSDL